jgi:hypothetical protein
MYNSEGTPLKRTASADLGPFPSADLSIFPLARKEIAAK